MAAYVGLAFLSFLWGSSFLLIKIASRAFDPFDFALARVSGRGDAADQRPFEEGLAGITTCTMGQTLCARADRAGRSRLAARRGGDSTTSADILRILGSSKAGGAVDHWLDRRGAVRSSAGLDQDVQI